MDYQIYSQKEAEKDGISYIISSFSTKMVEGDRTIGVIVFEDRPLNLKKSFIERYDDKKASYYNALHNANSILLRKIWVDNTHRYNGSLEDFFDYVVNNIVPQGYVIWTNPTIGDIKNYIQQIGGFDKPIYEIPNKAILLFSVVPLI